MESNDTQVRNACRDALAALWSDGGAKTDYATAAEWRSHWASHGVGDALDPKALKPLVEPEPEEVATHHDE